MASASASYGYVAALVSCIAFGSFGVPIKGETANRVQIDPLVMQTYKTGMCFLTSWTVLLLGERFQFTPWGILSGLFWVPGGTAGIYALRNAGLALSQGTWSALKVMVGFVWGVFIFCESVQSRAHATLTIALIISGLWGMSYFSSPKQHNHSIEDHDRGSLAEPLLAGEQVNDSATERGQDGELSVEQDIQDPNRCCFKWKSIQLTRRQIGYLCAVFDGVWGGSILVPMHFARSNAEGLGYVISFAIGATIVLTLMWILRLCYHCTTESSIREATARLPSLHFREMWRPGGLAGLLWSVGNIASMISVANLGEGVGYSIVQAQLLVAGLWGILWYREVQGTHAIAGWFMCACLTVAGIIYLSHEHVKSR